MWEFFEALTWAYVVSNYPGVVLLIAGAVLSILLAWKMPRGKSVWTWNPRQVFGVGLGLIAFFLIGLGTWLLFNWSP